METVIEVFKLLIIPICLALFGVYIKRRFDKHDKADEERAQFWFLIHKEASAGISLADEATTCIKRSSGAVPHNGELDKAQEYAMSCKHKAEDFVAQHGSKNLI